jgi:hypothetical protein
MYRHIPTENLSRYFPVWINSAVSFYFSFGLFPFVVFEFVLNDETSIIPMTCWSLHNFANVTKNCLLAAGIYFAKER